ncbi:MAG: TetR/AcrR family transcriptional regulator [Rhodospirillaceae bacterium]
MPPAVLESARPRPPRPRRGGNGVAQTKAEQRQASMENLLAAALRLFITQGYHATSVEEIAAAAGLTKGAVYFYFKSKAKILMDLLDRVEALAVEPSVQAAAAAGGSPRARLVAFMHTQSMTGAERAELMLLAILMATEFQGTADPAERRLKAIMGRMYALLEGIIGDGKASGDFRGDLGTAEMVSLVMAVNQGCFLEWYRRRRELDGPELVRAMRSIVLDGVTAR